MLILSKRLIKLNAITTLIIFGFAGFAALCAFYGTNVGLDTFESSSEQIKEREEEMNEKIESAT